MHLNRDAEAALAPLNDRGIAGIQCELSSRECVHTATNSSTGSALNAAEFTAAADAERARRVREAIGGGP